MGEETKENEGLYFRRTDEEAGEEYWERFDRKSWETSVEEERTIKTGDIPLTEEELTTIFGLVCRAKAIEPEKEPGVWHQVASRVKEETLFRDGKGRYCLVTKKRAGASEEGLKIVQKRSRELMTEADAQYWAMENLREEEYDKAFPRE